MTSLAGLSAAPVHTHMQQVLKGHNIPLLICFASRIGGGSDLAAAWLQLTYTQVGKIDDACAYSARSRTYTKKRGLKKRQAYADSSRHGCQCGAGDGQLWPSGNFAAHKMHVPITRRTCMKMYRIMGWLCGATSLEHCAKSKSVVAAMSADVTRRMHVCVATRAANITTEGYDTAGKAVIATA